MDRLPRRGPAGVDLRGGAVALIHYHGTPISPRAVLYELAGRNFCVPYSDSRDVEVCHRIGQSVMLDNGAYSVWRRGAEIDWSGWAEWIAPWIDYRTTWAVLPDSVEGGEQENDDLLREWGTVAGAQGVPVWHLHESLDRLLRLVAGYGRVCFGSSGAYAVVGSESWRRRVDDAFNALADSEGRVPWVHMLRGMSLAGSEYPFSSVDSTDVARNHNRPQNTARAMVDRWDVLQNPARWNPREQLVLEEAA